MNSNLINKNSKKLTFNTILPYLSVIWVSGPFFGSYFAIKYSPFAPILIGIYFIVTVIPLLFLFRNQTVRMILGNFLAVLCIGTIFEFYLSINAMPKFLPKYKPEHPYFISSDTLGYRVTPNNTCNSLLLNNKDTLYNVKYTIDSNGQRITPTVNNDSVSVTIVFFGDSFTFGDGLNDNQSLPYRVGIKGKGKVKVYNFALHGYGPHQMLASIESGLVEKIIQPKGKVYFVFQSITDHLRRCSGDAPWDSHGPKYLINKDNKLHNTGHFDDDFFKFALNRSYIYKAITKNGLDITHDKIKLYAAIMETTKNDLLAKYPDAQFKVIYWDLPTDETNNFVITSLREKNIDISLISKDIGIDSVSLPEYVIKDDNHPNVKAVELLSDFLIKMIKD